MQSELNVDALAQEIRRVDGNHSLGAGALAEALMPLITAALSDQDRAVEVKGLTWVEDWGGSLDDIPEWRARTPWGSLSASVAGCRDASGNRYECHCDVPTDLKERLITEATAHYEAKIRSALVDVPVEPAVPTANCCVCGRIIDTREKSEGGDDFGDETEPGKWTCSVQCYDAYVGFVPDEPAPHKEGEDSAAVTAAIRRAGTKARDELLERMADGGSVDNDLADYMTRIVDACERAALAATRSGSATTSKGIHHD